MVKMVNITKSNDEIVKFIEKSMKLQESLIQSGKMDEYFDAVEKYIIELKKIGYPNMDSALKINNDRRNKFTAMQ
nr:MAG TPA: hypothetical protein [Caudoviricetes sp.]